MLENITMEFIEIRDLSINIVVKASKCFLVPMHSVEAIFGKF